MHDKNLFLFYDWFIAKSFFFFFRIYEFIERKFLRSCENSSLNEFTRVWYFFFTRLFNPCSERVKSSPQTKIWEFSLDTFSFCRVTVLACSESAVRLEILNWHASFDADNKQVARKYFVILNEKKNHTLTQLSLTSWVITSSRLFFASHNESARRNWH
jgi:hypothetical protein